jgi:hypothetical protein
MVKKAILKSGNQYLFAYRIVQLQTMLKCILTR